MNWSALFAEHIAIQQQRLEQALAATELDQLLIFSGCARMAFLDDHAYPFVSNPHFRRWLPLEKHPECALLLRPGQRPRLYYANPTDFWHLSAGSPSGFWTESVEVVEIERLEQISDDLDVGPSTAFIGEELSLAQRWGISQLNPQSLMQRLDWAAAIKTEYELACLRQATRVAVEGHLAAAEAFVEGYSEFGINLAYLAATAQRESELPYGNIVALNQHAAILHYQQQDRQRPDARYSFLLDAGAQYQGYAADITRSYVAEGARNHTPAGKLFGQLIEGVDRLQQQLCQNAVAGVDFVGLNQQCHVGLAELLVEHKLLHCSVEQALEQGLTRIFLPHGLGHLLGAQVHDAGGRQASIEGGLIEPPSDQPMLRLTRELQAGMVITIEPGLYFIEPLLAQLAESPQRSLVNWTQLDALRPYGGIRVEDNLLIGEQRSENMTRDTFEALA